MATSSTAIANKALSHLGVASTIADLDTESSAEARAAREFYEDARDEVLRDFPWPFATKVVSLALVTDYTAETSTTYPEYGYAYRYPADAVRLLRIRSGAGRIETNSSRVRMRIISDDVGKLLLTDSTPAWLEYVAKETDVSRYDADFANAFALYLASMIAPRVTGGDPNNLGLKCLQKYELARGKAMANALNEQTGDEGSSDESGFTAARV